MKNKALIGGIIVLVIIFLIGAFCYWTGNKINNWIRNTDENNVTKTDGNTQNPSTAPNSPEQAQAVFLALGNPSNAGTDPNNYLLLNNYFALSYNRDKGIPNWVAWRISKSEIGDNPRPNPDPFRPDDRLPKGWKRVTPTDYTGSGFDKGHLCPSADRSASVEGMTATFLMTNMIPQFGDLNRGPWQKFEAYLRTLVTRGSDVYIYSGVYGDKGKVKNKVSIPAQNWKIAVVVPAGAPVSAITANTRVIAVDMPNVKGILKADWQTYRTTVRQIEQKTNLNLLSNLPQNIQDALENKTDNINN